MTHDGSGLGEEGKRRGSYTARYLHCHDRDGSYGKLAALRSQRAGKRRRESQRGVHVVLAG